MHLHLHLHLHLRRFLFLDLHIFLDLDLDFDDDPFGENFESNKIHHDFWKNMTVYQLYFLHRLQDIATLSLLNSNRSGCNDKDEVSRDTFFEETDEV